MDNVPSFSLVTVNAFAHAPFTGNPAAVCVSEQPLPDDFMQHLAGEMNLSETAFVVPLRVGAYSLRWFTPLVEVDLCGHATLASAHVLFSRDEALREVAFQTLSGTLTCVRDGDRIEMDFPSEPPLLVPPVEGLATMLGAEPVACAQNRMDLVVELASEAEVRALTPDMSALARIPVRGVIATARAAPETGAAVVSRFFGPRVGVPEDPVTGSAHCGLAPYWASRLGTTAFRCYQASARGGYVDVHLNGDRVTLGGTALTMFSLTPHPAIRLGA